MALGGLEAAISEGQPEDAQDTLLSFCSKWNEEKQHTKKERFAQKMLAVKKALCLSFWLKGFWDEVPIFRHLNKQQTEKVVMSGS